jgi:hypothetical protein
MKKSGFVSCPERTQRYNRRQCGRSASIPWLCCGQSAFMRMKRGEPHPQGAPPLSAAEGWGTETPEGLHPNSSSASASASASRVGGPVWTPRESSGGLLDLDAAEKLRLSVRRPPPGGRRDRPMHSRGRCSTAREVVLDNSCRKHRTNVTDRQDARTLPSSIESAPVSKRRGHRNGDRAGGSPWYCGIGQRARSENGSVPAPGRPGP